MEDKYAGQGGTYLIDPKTGKRKLIRQTQKMKAHTVVTPLLQVQLTQFFALNFQ